jgi:Ras-related GTP-binding protein C/D
MGGAGLLFIAFRGSFFFSENFRHIQQRVIDELFDISPEYEQMPVNFHLTSVYDHSIREAFSRVLHKLIDSLPYLEDLLNVFCSVSDLARTSPDPVPDNT